MRIRSWVICPIPPALAARAMRRMELRVLETKCGLIWKRRASSSAFTLSLSRSSLSRAKRPA
jgi:hypothetical protein